MRGRPGRIVRADPGLDRHAAGRSSDRVDGPFGRLPRCCDRLGRGCAEGDVPPCPSRIVRAEALDHWAYQPIKRTVPPAVKGSAWVRNPIDRFTLAGLEEMDLAPAPEADRPALIRRVTYDLTGLPPAPAEVDAFVRDDRPDAYERLVNRLLNSPHFGERWGQHWLDLAHYADSNGFELDAERPDAWRYRDWVVRSLNVDMPYDRFLWLQLAGDEMQPGDHDALIATGFCRCGPREVVGGNVIPEVKRQSELSEITGTVGSVFLGLTIACARCHDHKFDAIPTTDYYRLQSFFAASELEDVSDRRPGRARCLRRGPEGGERQARPAPERAGAARGPLSRGDQDAQARNAQRRGATGIEHPVRQADRRPEEAGRGAGDFAPRDLGGCRGGRGRRPARASPARGAEAGHRGRRADAAAPAGGTPWPWSITGRKRRIRSSSAAATTRAMALGSLRVRRA